MKLKHLSTLTALLALLSVPITAVAQGTAFNYTGQLMFNGLPAFGEYLLQFELYDAPTNGSPLYLGAVSPNPVQTDLDGVFTVSVDFGTDVFEGVLRWLEIQVATNDLSPVFAILAPRQPLALETNVVVQDLAAQRLVVGEDNIINGVYSSILGGLGNQNNGNYAVICGGVNNSDSGNKDFIGGGEGNTIESGSQYSTIVCGVSNRIRYEGYSSSILGGGWNAIEKGSDYDTIAGGERNYIGNDSRAVTISGGAYNTNWSHYATIGGGSENRIHGPSGATHGKYSTIAGGKHNWIDGNATDYSFIGGGSDNKIGQGAAYSMIPGGQYNEVSGGSLSFAAGYRAKVNPHSGTFLWADSQQADFTSQANDEVAFRCQGGVRFTSGSGSANQTIYWNPGDPGWNTSCDRSLKEEFTSVDGRQVLEKVARLPVTEWNFKGYPQRHIGPVAQDFHALFPLNDSDTTLNSADLDGVALAAIQGLNQVVREKEQRISELERAVAALQNAVEQLKRQQNGGAK